jgi:hypothetical protein
MVRRSIVVGLTLATALALTAFPACGPSASNDPVVRATHACAPGYCVLAGSEAQPDGGIGNAPLEPWPDESAGLYSGVYAIHGVVTATVLTIKLSLEVLYRLRILQETSGTNNIMQSLTLCALKLPSVPGIATIAIPPRLAALIPEKSIVVSVGNFLTSVNGVERYDPPSSLLVLGARLKNPATDPLPSMMDAGTEWDEDMDGHPGVTVDSTTVTCSSPQKLYVAIRTSGQFSGTFSGFDTIQGTLTFSESESVLGYSDPCLSIAAGIKVALEPSTSFVAQRLATEEELRSKGNVSCADIVAEAPKLYGGDWTSP